MNEVETVENGDILKPAKDITVEMLEDFHAVRLKPVQVPTYYTHDIDCVLKRLAQVKQPLNEPKQ